MENEMGAFLAYAYELLSKKETTFYNPLFPVYTAIIIDYISRKE